MAVVQTTLGSDRGTHDLGADIKQVGLLVVVLEQEIIKVRFGPFGVFRRHGPVIHGTIVVSQTPGTSLGADGDVGGDVVDLGSGAQSLGPICERIKYGE